jgi:hypothetical protein
MACLRLGCGELDMDPNMPLISGNFEYESQRQLHKFSNEFLNSRFWYRMKELRIFEVDGLF